MEHGGSYSVSGGNYGVGDSDHTRQQKKRIRRSLTLLSIAESRLVDGGGKQADQHLLSIAPILAYKITAYTNSSYNRYIATY